MSLLMFIIIAAVILIISAYFIIGQMSMMPKIYPEAIAKHGDIEQLNIKKDRMARIFFIISIIFFIIGLPTYFLFETFGAMVRSEAGRASLLALEALGFSMFYLMVYLKNLHDDEKVLTNEPVDLSQIPNTAPDFIEAIPGASNLT